MSVLLRTLIALMAVTAASVANGEWEYTDKQDPFEDSDRSLISPATGMYENDEELVIIATCQFDGLNIRLGHSFMVGDSDEEVRVQMRVDENEAYGPEYWSLTSDSEGSWMPMRDVPRMIAQMRTGTRLIFRVVDPADGETLNQAVSLFGFSEALKKLSCYRNRN
ncbi:MAG: invasion associated locus B family protein [Woeseiaceae bacterium]|nr:invasion associated locus B family protein [Woeseiaceae bacterium]